MQTTLQHDFDLPAVDSRFTERLPGDPQSASQRRQVHGAAWSRVDPTPVPEPRTVAWSPDLAEQLGLPEAFCESQAFAEVMAGNRLLPGMQPYAMCYGGHQFGQWAGQLGDGRAINLGEIVDREGLRQVLQLKGAGPTPYSRMADGRAVLRSSIREFLCSEAMHHLGVPTTRALSLVTTGEEVTRDMFYDGHPEAEPGAIVCRVAPSFLRPGNFELPAARGDRELLRRLVQFSISEDFPELGDPGEESTLVAWYAEICRRTADLMVEWARVGFVHGVMNTDNLSVLGLTLDYGPYGWLDDYDPNWTPNTTDAQGRRYRFGHQPQVAMWNMAQFGNALASVTRETDGLQEALDAYPRRFQDGWRRMMAAKLGLGAPRTSDDALFTGLEGLLQAAETDMTIFFRALADLDPAADWGAERPLPEPLMPALYRPDETDAAYREQARDWLGAWGERLGMEARPAEERRAAMRRVNPRFVLRNYLAQLAIDQATAGDPQMVRDLLDVLRRPYDDQPGHDDWAARRPDWARNRPGCSMLSCSS